MSDGKGCHEKATHSVAHGANLVNICKTVAVCNDIVIG